MTAREGRNFRKIGGPAFGINLYDPNGLYQRHRDLLVRAERYRRKFFNDPAQASRGAAIFFADDLYDAFLRWYRELQHDLIARTTKSNLRRATPAQLASALSR